MIVDKKDSPSNVFDIPNDAPPAYDDVDSACSTQPIASSSSGKSSSQAHSSPFTSWMSRASSTTNFCGSMTRRPSQKLHRPITSFSSEPKQDKIPPIAVTPKAQADVRETVRGLVHDLVQGSSPARSCTAAAMGVLDSCVAACTSHHLSLARVLQERSIEHHAPIYWAIVSRRPSDEDDAFLLALLAQAAPLTSVAVSELRAACLVASDNALFQRLRAVPGVIPLSGTDRILLAGSNVPTSSDSAYSDLEKRVLRQKSKEEMRGFDDVANVHEGGAGPEAESFSVSLHLKIFQRRLRVSGELAVEFIARGRLWLLMFFVVPPFSSFVPSALSHTTSTSPASSPPATNTVLAGALEAARARSLPPGTWAIALALLEGSPQCYADARLVVAEPSPEPDPSRSPPPLPGRPHPAASVSSTSRANSNSRNPFRMVDRSQPPLHPMQSSFGSEPKSTRLYFFGRRTGNEDNRRTKKPAIVLHLTSVRSSPLLALPSPSFSSAPSSLEEVDASSNTTRSKERRRPNREEKRAAQAAATRERRARAGRETWKERQERTRMAGTVLLAGLEETQAFGTSGRKEKSSRSGVLMYDGCPYIAPDGTLRAVLEARLTTSVVEAKDSDCTIC